MAAPTRSLRRRTLLAAALVASTAAGGATAAAGSAPPNSDIATDGFEELGDVTIEVLAEENEEAMLDRAIEIFQEDYPNVSFDITYRAFDDYMQVAPNIMLSDDAPDLAQGNQGYTIDGLLVEAGLILPLDDYAAVYGWEESFGAGTLDQFRFTDDGSDFGTGTLWGVTPPVVVVGVFYNREKVEALGELPTTFAEFEELLAAASDADELPIQLGNAEGWPALHVAGVLQAAHRPAAELRDWVFGEPGSTIDTPEDLEAMSTLAEWAEVGYLPDGVNGVAADDAVSNFANGDGVFLIAGNWYAAELAEPMGDNVGFMPMPVGPSGQLGATGSLALPWHISTQAEHPDLVAAFIALLASEEFAPVVAEVGRVPAVSFDNEGEGLFAEVIDGSNAVVEADGLILYADWATDTMFNTLTAKTQELLAGRIDAQQYVTDVQADWDAYFEG